MALEDFATPTDWARDLDVRWPERIPMKAALIGSIVQQVNTQPRLLELGIGDGEMLDALARRLPNAEFVAVDVNQTLLTFVGERLKGQSNVMLVRQDLRKARWTQAIGTGFDVVYSLQSLHDLGGRDSLSAVYGTALALLKPGGLLLNADFIEAMPQDDPANPRRFPFPEHAAVLDALRAKDAKLLHVHGLLGCISARARSDAGIDVT